jgi:hypothetical protein
MAKPFSEALYTENDDAKHQVVEWLLVHGFETAIVNPDQYGIDILAEKDGQKYEIEVEVKHNWKGEKFPFSEVHFPERKRKFAKKTEYVWFFMLNHERTHGLIVDGFDFVNGTVVRKHTSEYDNDLFVEIPTFNCKFVSMER